MTRHTATVARTLAAGILAAGVLVFPVRAEDKPDPVVAKIGAEVVHLSDVTNAADTLPPQQRQSMPRDQLLVKVLDQLVDTHVLAIEARKAGIDKNPLVQRALHEIEERTLVTAFLQLSVGTPITEAAVKARFEKEIGSQPPVQEVHARHILVEDEATAKKIIAELKNGADFVALSKQYSKDTAAVEQGGDLGYFKASDMVPEFSAAAFALKDKEISPAPVHTPFGWHVIQTLDHRNGTPPTFEQSRDKVLQQMLGEEEAAVQKVIAKARADVPVERFNLDGTPVRATDHATPPAKK